MKSQAAQGFCQPVISFQTSHRLFLSLPPIFFPPLFSLGPWFSLQKSVVQQLNSSGWRHSVCAGRSPHSASGPQLHQPHHRGSLQGPQGPASSVSKAAPIAVTKTSNLSRQPCHYSTVPGEIKAKIWHFGAMNTHVFDVSFVFVIFDILELGGPFIHLVKAKLFIFSRHVWSPSEFMSMWLLWRGHSSLWPQFMWKLLFFLVSFLTLFLLSGCVLGFLFCLEHWSQTNLNVKVFHILILPRDPLFS